MIKLYDKIMSGSSGNSIVYFEDLMVDVGVAYTKVEPFLPDIKYILFTHRHTDHLRATTVKRIAKNYPDIKMYGNSEVYEKLKEIEIENAHEVNEGSFIVFKNYIIKPVELKHDVLCYGYLINRVVNERVLHIDNEENDKDRVIQLLHATDTYDLVGIEAKDLDAYFVEFNHCEELIDKNIKKKTDENKYAYEINAKQNHQSNQRIMDWLSHNNVSGLVVPMHISSKNNTRKEIEKYQNKIEFLYGGGIK